MAMASAMLDAGTAVAPGGPLGPPVTRGQLWTASGTRESAADVRVRLSESGMYISVEGDQHLRRSHRLSCAPRRRTGVDLGSVHFSDVLAAVKTDIAGCLRLVHCPRSGGQGPRLRQDVWLSLDSCAAVGDEAGSWQDQINRCCCSARWQKPRNFLVFVNPSAGSGSAPRGWGVAEELWGLLPWMSWEVISTTRGGQVKEHVQTADLSSYDGIVIVSGDGLIYEAFCGLASRADAQSALQIPIGHIPGGSGNAFAKSVLHACGEDFGVLDAAFLIARGGAQPIHLSHVRQPELLPSTSFLSVAGGIIADIDIESEFLRFLGGARFTLYAIYRMLRPRTLRARLAYWPTSAGALPSREPPPLEADLTGQPWELIEDEFAVFWAMNMAWAAYNTHVAPGLKYQEDKWFLILIRGNPGRLALAQALLAFDSGGHVALGCVDVVECSAFRLTPLSDVGLLAVDGEQVPLAPLQVWPCPHGSGLAMGA